MYYNGHKVSEIDEKLWKRNYRQGNALLLKVQAYFERKYPFKVA